MERVVKLCEPYHFQRALKRLSMDPLLHLSCEEQWLLIPLWLGNDTYTVRVSQIGTADKPEFVITACGNPPEEVLLEKVAHLMHWNIPLEKISTRFSKTELAPIIAKLRSTPFICDFQLYGTLMKTIIHQQLNMKFAYTLTARFIKTFGFYQEGAWFYPSPERVSDLTVEELRALQFSGRKAEYIIDTSQLIAGGGLDLEALHDLTDDEIVKQLTAIRGIGRWTAENFMMFGMGRLDLFPANDIGIQNAVKQLQGMSSKPSPEALMLMGEQWHPYRTYASLYLWESLQEEKVREGSRK